MVRRSGTDAHPKSIHAGDRAWTIRSYYAPGVGLVSATQVDADGATRFTLELTAYTVQ